MQFHTFLLDKESSNLCVLITPFGKFKHASAAVGFLNSPSWAQAAMSESFHHLPGVDCCADGLAAFSNDLESHLKMIKKVLSVPESHNFTVKAAKCHWIKSEAPWLGHTTTQSRIKPNPDKIKPMLDASFPETVTE